MGYRSIVGAFCIYYIYFCSYFCFLPLVLRQMKIVLVFKTPDVLDQIDDLIDDWENESDDRIIEVLELRRFVEKYVKHSEYIRVEFDTDNKTATVLEKGA